MLKSIELVRPEGSDRMLSQMVKGAILVARSLSIVAVMSVSAHARIIVQGSAVNLSDFLNTLMGCTGGASVSLDASNRLTIGADGNAYADILRAMANDTTKNQNINLVRGSSGVFIGAFQPHVGDVAQGATTVSNGSQTIDMGDVDTIGSNHTFPFKPTAWGALMHELTEVYASTTGNLSFNDAHNKAIANENVSYSLERTGTTRQFDNVQVPQRLPEQRPGGGYTFFVPVVNDLLGPGWWTFDWDIMGGFGNPTTVDWDYFGQYELRDAVIFNGNDIQLTGINFAPVPEPSTVTAFSIGGLCLLWNAWRRRGG